MNLPNKITISRIISTPVFLGLFLFIKSHPGNIVLLSLLWLLYLAGEFSDILDGYIARKYNLVSDVGKLLDPFADVISRVTMFLCLTHVGMMPVWIFAIIIYRELGITFLRMMMLGKGKAQGARIGGKLKAWFYFFSGFIGLIYYTMLNVGIGSNSYPLMNGVTLVVFILAALSSVLSFIDYFRVFLKMQSSK
ncbi:CDP-diacylglycerol--glycerol-3-phosphate 3-phosphatidyltransferase [Spirochaeta cellobiosiphila]|uniref:CDP-diacylglycerol--glycerol-3-phosphate 3-phosphatidyltransferase n=1 Tax=Spirochaeta cellobiosiphila TaxID=504483 RepID=UPI000418107E|nr:CDP-diacylglycerol--glycerol-3-phosphate 3-phosphatidyltransferase [Spirochaeta cellobiosiphila]